MYQADYNGENSMLSTRSKINPRESNTPSGEMERILGLRPLNLFIQKEAVSARLKIPLLLQNTWDEIAYVKEGGGRTQALAKSAP